jgi:hypothetical protein
MCLGQYVLFGAGADPRIIEILIMALLPVEETKSTTRLLAPS